ncbi:MAG: endopeptidase La [Gemmatimonadetes bacterium]|nr:endopeptidase La [Gemmatimonadota bacterium]
MTAPGPSSIADTARIERPLLVLRSTAVFPRGTVAVQMGAPENVALLKAHPEHDLEVIVAVAPLRGAGGDAVGLTGRIGVLSRVVARTAVPGDTLQVTLEGLARVRIGELERRGAVTYAEAESVTEGAADVPGLRMLLVQLADAADRLIETSDVTPPELSALVRLNAAAPGYAADVVASRGPFRAADKDEVLQRLDVSDRVAFVLARLEKELARSAVLEDVRVQTDANIERHHREFFLRQQLRAIQAELGEGDAQDSEVGELLRQIEEATLPPTVATEARREAARLRGLSSASSEYQVLRNYLEWVLALPWGRTEGAADIVLDRVEEALDRRHWGLREAKDRILEHLAVHKLRGGHAPGPILCFVGPPGTGKTSLGEAIAAAIGRKFYRISVGGVRDEAEIRGHRRTYVGSLPGLLVQALRRVGVSDPVFLIDEIDKMAAGGPTGDPAAAMLEVLDPSQNATFVDHFLNLPVDLSSVLFIATANNLFDIPAALRDRLEVIRIAGYTIEEKVEIAWRYLLPRLLEEHGISDLDLQFTDEALGFLASRYAREAGLRNFERNLSAIMRKRARRKADGEVGAWVVDQTRIEELLGPPRYAAEAAEQAPEVGAVTGLAWTATGGELMTIEALLMSGSGRLLVTGQLGDVMRESVDAACSYVRSRARTLRLGDPELKHSDLHIHFPAGSVPKDGPSAGVAVTLAIASVMSRRAVRRDVAVTGEVTLRGKVIEVGGVKEKILAAYRSGLREVVLPAANEKDLRELPDEVRTQVRFSFVHTMDEAIEKLLLPAAPLGFADDLPLFEEGRLTVEGGRKTADGGRWTVDGGTSKEPPAAPDAPR